jgi:hypothetical protein
MRFITTIQDRIKQIDKEAVEIVRDMSTSLTVKNRLMEPLLDEKKILEETLRKLEALKTKNYFGLCNPK